ncbi:MAG: hypothetical protein VYB37_01990 [Pseudomonadota bacterium]|nr:hypothetical protein [Pseudomonadota bacterium]
MISTAVCSKEFADCRSLRICGRKINASTLVVLLFLIGSGEESASSGSMSGRVGFEVRHFTQTAGHSLQSDRTSSAVTVEPHWRYESGSGHQLLDIALVGRTGSVDPQQNSVDAREVLFSHLDKNWEFHAGLGQFFWGVTESHHVVDVINQVDLVENIDGEDKLGQPVINLTKLTDRGAIDVYFLPVYRERRYPGAKGRLRSEIPVAPDLARFESRAGRHRLDVAARVFNTFGDIELALSAFAGTARSPQLTPAINEEGDRVLAPFYPVIVQWGIETQHTGDSLLLKLEGVRRRGDGNPYYVVAGGFEHGHYGILDSDIDLAILLEGSFDSRTAGNGALENDVFSGLRLSFNDAQTTEVLAGVIADTKNSSKVFDLEGSRRLGENWKIQLQVRLFRHIAPGDPLMAYQADSFISLRFSRYF